LRYLKKFLTVIIIFCSFIICGISGTQQVSASESGKTDTSYTIIYDDSAYLIKDTDKPQLYDVMESISKDTNVIFYTTDSTEYGRNTADICQNYCAEHFGSSKTAPVIMFTIDIICY
jgi:hypothetical protein